MHLKAGNLGLADGSVAQATESGLMQTITAGHERQPDGHAVLQLAAVIRL